MQWVMFFLSRTGFEIVPPQVVVLLQNVFAGLAQSRLIEDPFSCVR